MSILEIIAFSNLALIDIVAFEVLLAILFHVDSSGRIKFTLDRFFGLSKFVSTSIFVVGFLVLGFLYFIFSNYFQDIAVVLMVKHIGWNLITLFFVLLSFAVFWICKILLGRRLKFFLCWLSLTFWILFSLVFFIILIMKYAE